MANPSGSGADAAYARAVTAFGAQSYDIARRWVLEALAQDPEHAGARTLLARLDSVRRPPAAPRVAARSASPFGPPGAAPVSEPVAVDPTVLIGQANRPGPAEVIEPTVLVRRDEPRRASTPDPFRQASPPPYDPAPVSEPTVIGRSPALPPTPPPRTAPAGGGLVQRWRDLLGGGSTVPRPPAPAASRKGGISPAMRGTALVVAALVAAVLLVAFGIFAVRWMWPAGQLLTVTRPTGGTIVGPGIECGSKGKDCSTTRTTGESVELEPRPDAGFVFSGFTGDCAPVGRLAMTGPRSCGATFDPVTAAPAAATFPLTITKPAGGTLAGEPNILCGTLDNVCSASIPSGTTVTMRFQADTNFTFQSFTGDCAPSGEMVMNAAKTCGAIFMPTPGATVVNRDTPPVSAPIRRPSPRTPDESAVSKPAPTNPVTPPVAPPVVQQAPPPAAAQPAVPGPPAAAPITAEQHAKDEIEDLVKRYCAANETLKPEAVRNLFPLAPMATYREQFRQYKTLKCVITSKPEFQRLDASATGGAQVLFGMKQIIEMKSGGAPKVYETNVTMVVSRTSFQAHWFIDRLVAELKPK
jgi:hypothetical protein